MRAFTFLTVLIAFVSAAECKRKGKKDGKSRNKGRVVKKGSNNAGSKVSGSDSSLTLDRSVLQEASSRTGFNASNPAQVASRTSNNNFINFCKGKTLTNGAQVKEGSCNGIVMGDIPSTSNMVGAKFKFPKNFDKITAFQDFKVELQINGIETGSFTNPASTYYSSPQKVNKQGQIIGHTHIVINKINSFQDTAVADPLKFAFFKGIDPAAQGGISSVVVLKGLEPGFYRICSINTASNHQPVLMPVAQHNANDDCTYFQTEFQKVKRGNNGRRHHAGNPTLTIID